MFIRLFAHYLEHGSYDQRDVYFGASDLTHAHFQVFHNKDLNEEEFLNAVMSSSAAPGVFQTQNWNNATYGDGGGFFKIDYWPMIEECRKRGFADEDIIIDAVFCYHHEVPTLDIPENFKVFNLLERYVDMIFVEWFNHYIPQAHAAYPKINWRYLVMPTKKLPDGKIPLFFKHDDIVGMYNAGFDDATNKIQQGEGVAWKEAFGIKQEETDEEFLF